MMINDNIKPKKKKKQMKFTAIILGLFKKPVFTEDADEKHNFFCQLYNVIIIISLSDIILLLVLLFYRFQFSTVTWVWQ